MEHGTLTVPKIAAMLGRPEPTVRRWSRQFADYIPGRRKGGRYHYPHESLRLFTYIGNLFQSGLTTEQVMVALKENHEAVLAGKIKVMNSPVLTAESEKPERPEQNWVPIKDSVVEAIYDFVELWETQADSYREAARRIPSESLRKDYTVRSSVLADCAANLRHLLVSQGVVVNLGPEREERERKIRQQRVLAL